MRSITLAQAALFAALAMLLLTGYYVVDDFELLGNSPVLVLLGSVVPSLVWAGFFAVVYRGASVIRLAAWLALVFAVILEAAMACIRFQQSVNYWTPFGNAISLPGWLLRIGWAVFLASFALAPEHAQDNSLTRKIALVLAILSAPSALSTALDGWTSWTGFLFDDIPKEAYWRVLITPAIRIIYWASQILFLWIFWEKSERRKAVEAASMRFTP